MSVLQHVTEELSLMLTPLLFHPFHNLPLRKPPPIIRLQRFLIDIPIIMLNAIIKYLFPIVILSKVLWQVFIVHPKIHSHGSIRRTPQAQIFPHHTRDCSFCRFQQCFIALGKGAGQCPSRSVLVPLGIGFDAKENTGFQFAVAGFDVAGGIRLCFAGGGCEWKSSEQLLIRRHNMILRLIRRHKPRILRILLPIRPYIISQIPIFPFPLLNIRRNDGYTLHHDRHTDSPRLTLLPSLSI
mmetsp:Transcript_11022/g.24307  ORF Transcript_11022/g.24307 Transcript_11022/m.24307 type:complete len:240 (-) Transcript_11022:499-1218(-)